MLASGKPESLKARSETLCYACRNRPLGRLGDGFGTRLAPTALGGMEDGGLIPCFSGRIWIVCIGLPRNSLEWARLENVNILGRYS